MRKRKRILRIRPFNMANFSGGSGYMPLFALNEAIVFIPITVMIWTGMAAALKKEDGSLDYQRLKRRLTRILLPICAVLFALAFYLNFIGVYGNILAYFLATLWASAVPTWGIFCAIALPAKILSTRGHLYKGRWFIWSSVCAVAISLIGILVFILLSILGDSLYSSLNSMGSM